MKPKFVTHVLAVGAVAFVASLAVKTTPALGFLARSPFFEGLCSVMTALTFSAGMFLSLCGLADPTGPRRTYFSLHLVSLLVMCGMMTVYFEGYVVLSHVFSGMDAPAILPGLIDKAQSANSENARKIMAQDAYRIYGLTVTYRRDDDTLVNYQPTAVDLALREKFARDDAATAETRQALEMDLRLFPWLFGLYLGSFFTVYLAGTLWLLLRRPPARSP